MGHVIPLLRQKCPSIVCRFRRLLGAAIRRERERQGLSQRKLALMAGSNQTHIWHIEDGSVSIGLDLLCRIADSLGVKVADLIDF
ncbi:helix-turn-helix domain-containing protein [Slackia isoflavoniconvertens]|uniref:helix-turn-helix domain-containing protein n=1 Tax=Slackia isoflavoniconvertens TaxID=572010 RepID=UPI003AB456A0